MALDKSTDVDGKNGEEKENEENYEEYEGRYKVEGRRRRGLLGGGLKGNIER